MSNRWPYMGGTIYEEWRVDGKCPEHGSLCHEHAMIDGCLVQILRDEFGDLSPEHYTILRLRRRVERLKIEADLMEADRDAWCEAAVRAEAEYRMAVGELEVIS